MTCNEHSLVWTLIILAVIIGLVSSYPMHQDPFCLSVSLSREDLKSAEINIEYLRSHGPVKIIMHLSQRIMSNDEDNLRSLLDLSAEPAAEELSRQIMSEAKLWEAIQEASAELVRRRQDALLDHTLPLLVLNK